MCPGNLPDCPKNLPHSKTVVGRLYLWGRNRACILPSPTVNVGTSEDSMSQLGDGKVAATGEWAQLNMWEVPSRVRSNMVALYDLAPRFTLGSSDNKEGRKDILERDFSFGGVRYRITLKPTRMKEDDGRQVDRLLTDREQIVEEVIRRLACDRGRLSLYETAAARGRGAIRSQFNIRFSFSLHEVRQELARVKHTYSFQEIVKSIILLNEVRITIQDLDSRGSPLLSAPAFPVMAMRREGDEGAQTYVEFNPLVAEAIRSLSFQQVDYETLMKVRDPVARWLLKRLHVQMASTKQPVQKISANEIRRDSGMSEWAKSRDMFARVCRAVKLLVEHDVIDNLEIKRVKEGKKIVDILFTMSATPDFHAKVHGSNRVAKQNLDDFARLTNGAVPSDGFADISDTDAFRIRAGRSLEVAA